MIKIAFWIAGAISVLLVSRYGIPDDGGLNIVKAVLLTPIIAVLLIWLFARMGFEDRKPGPKN